MYKTAFLHVAYDKAGSTALQATSAAFRQELQVLGVNYPEPVKSIDHNRLASAFFTNPGEANFNKSGGRSTWSEARIRQEDKRILETFEEKILAGSGTLFLSFEGFIWLTSPEHIHLRDWVLKFAPEVKVIVYVRDPLGYAESAVSQRVRTGLPIRVGHHRHHVDIGKLTKVYGRQNVIVREFGREALDGGDVRHDCYSLMGLKQQDIKKLLAQETVAAHETNPALSMHAVGIGEALRQGLAGTQFLDLPGSETRFNGVFGNLLNGVPGPKFSLSVSEEIELFSRAPVRAAARYLLNEFGIDFRWRKSRLLRVSRLKKSRHRKQFEILRRQGVYTQLASFLIQQMASEIEQGTNQALADTDRSSAQSG